MTQSYLNTSEFKLFFIKLCLFRLNDTFRNFYLYYVQKLHRNYLQNILIIVSILIEEMKYLHLISKYT